MLGRLFGRSAPVEERSTINLSQYAHLWATSSDAYSPVSVSRHNAMTHAASSACIDVLASSVSQLPVDVVRYDGKYRRPVNPTPTLIATPSVMVEQDVWLYQLIDSLATDGNAFGMVMSVDKTARPTQIELVDPDVVVRRTVEGSIPQAYIGSERHKLYPWGDLFHVPGPFVRAGSPFGQSPVERAKATIGAALAAREYGSRFFGDGGHPGGIITSPEELTPEQAKAVKQSFITATRGKREPAVMGSGLSYTPIITDPNDSQFLELMQFCISEACRFWRVPPTMVYAAISGQEVSYTNASQSDLAYLKHSLERYLVRLERAMTKLLPRPQVVRFNRNAFLRSDAETRNRVHDMRLKNRTTTVNEVRAIEDEEPFPDPKFDQPAETAPAPQPPPPVGGA